MKKLTTTLLLFLLSLSSFAQTKSDTIVINLEKVIEDDAYRTQAECKSYDRLVKYFTWDATAEKVMQIAKDMNGEKE